MSQYWYSTVNESAWFTSGFTLYRVQPLSSVKYTATGFHIACYRACFHRLRRAFAPSAAPFSHSSVVNESCSTSSPALDVVSVASFSCSHSCVIITHSCISLQSPIAVWGWTSVHILICLLYLPWWGEFFHCFLIVQLQEFFVCFEYQSFLRYVFCKYFVSFFERMSFYFN